MHNKISVNGVIRKNDLAIIIIDYVNKYKKDCEKLCAQHIHIKCCCNRVEIIFAFTQKQELF